MTWKANTLTALILFLLIGSGTALSQFPPFQFLQKPGSYPVGLKVVNQYDPSRKFPATPDRPEAHGRQGSRPLQTLIWYPALQSSSKPMTVEPKSSDSFDCCLVLAWEDENQPGFGVTAREKRFDRERQSE
jgi:hypothetical protein